MVLFHLVWDLGDLGFISWRISAHESGKIIAHTIASSFLFLVGVSLVLAHRRGIRWKSFWRREIQLIALGLVITGFSAIFEPDQLVTFGILQAIAVVSLLALPTVRAPRVVPWLLAAVAVVLPLVVHLPGRSPWVSWTGLAEGTRPSLDWQPVLPWVAVTFVGVGLMRWVLDLAGAATVPGEEVATVASVSSESAVSSEEVATVARVRAWRPAPGPLQWVGVLGRHTLSIYVLHQPVLYGALWLIS